MPEFEIVKYSEDWAESHAALAERTYPGKRRRADPGYLRWKYQAPPTGEVPDLFLAVRHGEVIGQTGLMRCTLAHRGELVPVQWLCEIMVDPEARRLGVARGIWQAIFDTGIVTLGSDPSEAADKSLAKVGMGSIAASWVMILPLKLGPVVAARYGQAARAERLISLAGKPVVRFRNRALHHAAGSPDAAACSWRDVADLLIAKEAATETTHIVHDTAWLEWRCPGLDGWNRELEAVRTPAGSFAIIERDTARVTVHEWHAPTDEEAAKLFGRVLYLAGSYGVHMIETYAADAEEKARLERLAFQARRSRTTVLEYPRGYLADADGAFAFMGYDNDYHL